MTRRIIKPQPAVVFHGVPFRRVHGHGEKPEPIDCPYGQHGDRLWVRETWAPFDAWVDSCEREDPVVVRYKADGQIIRWEQDNVRRWYDETFSDPKWKPSIHMPRWASRITLEVTEVRVERLQDISEADAKAEGAAFGFWHPDEGVFAEPTDEEDERNSCYRDGFGFLWESINGHGSWEKNPWVWAVSFRSIEL